MKWPYRTTTCIALAALFSGCVAESPKKRDHDKIVINDEDGEPIDEIVISQPDDATPRPELIIELTWNTPADADQLDKIGADLDLHLRHPEGRWNEAPHDIFWGNPTADWGEEGPDDDPVLEANDSDGRGPELILYRGEPDADLEIAVHYYTDNGFGPSYPTVRVYRDGEAVFQRDTRLEPGEFWVVGQLGQDDVRPVDAITEEMPPS